MSKLSCMTLPVLAAGMASAKTSIDLKRPATTDSTVRVIVQYATRPQESHFRKVTDRQGRLHRKYDHISMAAYDVTESGLAALENDPDVTSISPDREVRGMLEHTGASVNLIPIHNYYNSIGRGKADGIGIAIIDSGIDQAHPNFKSYLSSKNRIVYNQSFVDSTPSDLYGHGTHVAGILAGTDNVTSSLPSKLAYYWGMVPDAYLINLKVLNANGIGSDSAVIAAIDRAIALKSTYNIRVINLSLGRPVVGSYKTDPLCIAVEKAWKAGIVVVVAAGNSGRVTTGNISGYGTITSPGNDPYVITVGAANTRQDLDPNNDIMTSYSSKGPTAIDHVVKPDLVAPGNLIVSYQAAGATLVTGHPANRIPTSSYDPAGGTTASPYYYVLSGTSMAAPVVSGAAAFLIDKNSSITPDQVKAKLMLTARKSFPTDMTITDTATNQTYSMTNDVFTVGAGMVDFWAAYNDTSLPTGTAASPSAYFDTASNTVKLSLNSTSATSVIWGTGSSLYGTSVIWGTTVTGNSIIWGTGIIWGTSTVSGFGIIWGTNPSAIVNAASTPTESLAVLFNGEK